MHPSSTPITLSYTLSFLIPLLTLMSLYYDSSKALNPNGAIFLSQHQRRDSESRSEALHGFKKAPSVKIEKHVGPERVPATFQDIWATLLFGIVFITSIVFSSMGVSHFSSPPPLSLSRNATIDSKGVENRTVTALPYAPSFMPALSSKQRLHLILLLSLCGSVTIVSAFIFAALFRRFTVPMIRYSFWGMIILSLAIAIGSAVFQNFILCAIFCFIAFTGLLFYLLWRKQFPFTALVMGIGSDILGKYPGTFMITLLAIFLSLGYTALLAVGIIGHWINLGQSWRNSGFISLVVGQSVAWYWTLNFVRYALHTIIAGTVASYYFHFGTNSMIAHPAQQSLKNMCSASTGAVAFASLLVPVFDMFRAFLRTLTSQSRILRMAVTHLVPSLQRFLDHFDSHALVEVSIYGKTYWQSSTHVLKLQREDGWHAVKDDLRTKSVALFATLTHALLVTALALGWSLIIFQKYSAWIVACSMVVFVTGYITMSMVTMAFRASVETILVCTALEPSVLQRTKPRLDTILRQAYPQASWTTSNL